MKRFLLCLPLAVCALCVAHSLGSGVKVATSVKINAHFYRLASPIDTNSIKAIGSVQTKASPTILQVSKAESSRVTALVTKAGGTLLGSPSVITPLDQAAKISTTEDNGGGCTMAITPTTRSDTITLNFKLSATSVQGRRKITRSASGMARLVETRSLLVIENPRDGQPGLLVVLEAIRQK